MFYIHRLSLFYFLPQFMILFLANERDKNERKNIVGLIFVIQTIVAIQHPLW